jgi:hypothetical protein
MQISGELFLDKLFCRAQSKNMNRLQNAPPIFFGHLEAHMNIRAIFTEPAKPKHPAFSCGFLVVIFVLLASEIQWHLSLPPTYSHDRYGNLVVGLMLLFNHLAYSFRLPTPATVAVRILAWSWLLFGCFYIFYWSRVLYP